ncbi:MAG: fatty acid desaturase [Pirellulaceae bacterium]
MTETIPKLATIPPLPLSSSRQADRELMIASRRFAQETGFRSWWNLLSTLSALAFFGSVAAFSQHIWMRGLGSLLTGLVIVRLFVIYHDYQHRAIFRGSRLAGRLLDLYGYLMLTPPSIWKQSHDHHHRNNSQLFGSDVGSFPILTTGDYRAAGWRTRLWYRSARHPSVLIFGYLTVFAYLMCVRPLLADPRQHWDAALSLCAHTSIIACLLWFTGLPTTLFVFVMPTWIATTLGAYLFYVQHNFPGVRLRGIEGWSYCQAALSSSSYLEMGRVMNWLTGNIGYHHVHHLNAKIPFYRLPEAMAELPRLQTPPTTTFRLRDVFGCLRLKLWDESQDRFVSFSEAAASRTD